MNKSFIVLITGANGAGKSSVSSALALKTGQCALIKVDDLRRMEAGVSLKTPIQGDAAKLQTSLAIKNTCALTNNFYESGLSVVVDCVTREEDLKQYLELLKDKQVKVFLLLPKIEILLKRFNERGGANDILQKRTENLYTKFLTEKDSSYWTVIDSSNQTLEETVEQIYKKITTEN